VSYIVVDTDVAHARLRGRPRPVNDTWIAACCIARKLSLATLNITDYADFAEHEGSNSSTEDIRRGMSHGMNHSA
jgi:predicted nucleic acid-binding protein